MFPEASTPAASTTRSRGRSLTRQQRLARFIGIVVAAVVLVGGGIYAGIALLTPLPTITATTPPQPPQTQAAAKIAWPSVGRTALGAVSFPGVLGSSGDQSQAPMASITKVVTALVVLEAKPLAVGEQGPGISYDQSDVDLYRQLLADGESVAPVAAGITLSERQSLEAMLIPSGGNYSIALAKWAYGSVSAYLTAAQAWLSAHGFSRTQVADPTGNSPESKSTPSELVELGKLALANPAIADIVKMPRTVLPVVGTLQNTNKLIGTHGVDGIKTGTTDEAGACLMFSAKYQIGSVPVTVVGVLIGGNTHPQINSALGALLDSVVPAFHEVKVVAKGQSLAEYTSVWQQATTARAGSDISILVWNDTPAEVSVAPRPVTGATAGSEVGTVTVTAGPQTATVPLVADTPIEDPGPWWRLTHPGALNS